MTSFHWDILHVLCTISKPSMCQHLNKQFSASSQPTVLLLDSLEEAQTNPFCSKVLKCWPAGGPLLIESLGNERDHKLPQMTRISETLFAVLKKRGQIRTGSQEVLKETFRNAAAKPTQSCKCHQLLDENPCSGHIWSLEHVLVLLFTETSIKGVGEAAGLGTLSIYMQTAVLGSGSIGPLYSCFPYNVLWQEMSLSWSCTLVVASQVC